jgi:hypothetical protein
MAILTEVGENNLLDFLFVTAGTELGLAIDADLTECTDPEYARIALDDYVAAAENGVVTNNVSITFNTGDEVVSYWVIYDPSNDAIVYDTLPSPQVGEFRFPIGALRLEAISG